MDGGALLVAAGSIASAGGVALLRRAWSLPRREAAANGLAWALLLAGVLLAGAGQGAWGVAIASLAAMTLAAIFLAQAAWTAPAGRAPAASQRRVHMLPEGQEPFRLGGRLLTFLISVPFAFLAATFAAFALRAGAGALGWADADANVLAFMAAPILWALLATILLMETRRMRQWVWLALPLIGGTAATLAGGAL